MLRLIETLRRPEVQPASDPLPSVVMESAIEFGTCSDTGRIRENNEDSFGVLPEINLFVLSDGMGGLAAGEVASRLTVDTILAHCSAAEADPSTALAGARVEGVTEISNRLASGIYLANRLVHRAAQDQTARQGMGATAVVARFCDERMSLAHVGDSRAYRLRGGRLEQLTQDHSLLAEHVRRGGLTQQEANRSNLQNVLLRAVGVEQEVEVDVSEELVMDGDIFLLCSDGLIRELSENQIAAILGEAKDPQQAADQLVELANEAGGGDNITVIVIHPSPAATGALSRASHFGKWFGGFRSKS